MELGTTVRRIGATVAKNVCVVCAQPVYMVGPGEGPVTCFYDNPDKIVELLGDGRELNAWGQTKLKWARQVLAGEIPLGPDKKAE